MFFPCEYRPTVHANEVYVSGSFDGWTSRHRLEKDREQGCFRVQCRIPREKKVYYKFIVDGEWYTSEEDTTESDEHGNVNNVVVYHAGDGDGDGGSGDTDADAAVIVHDSDGSSEFTSISHPNSETRWEEIQQEVEAANAAGDEDAEGDEDEDLTSSVQITLKDTSSVTASIQSRTTPSTKLTVPKHGDSFMGRLRSIFHK